MIELNRKPKLGLVSVASHDESGGQREMCIRDSHYIISFDPRDGTDNGLTVDRAQELGEQFCRCV